MKKVAAKGDTDCALLSFCTIVLEGQLSRAAVCFAVGSGTRGIPRVSPLSEKYSRNTSSVPTRVGANGVEEHSALSEQLRPSEVKQRDL